MNVANPADIFVWNMICTIWEECESEYTAKSGKKPSEIGAEEKLEVVTNMMEWLLEETIYQEARIS